MVGVVQRDDQAVLILRLRQAADDCIVLLGTGLLRDAAGQRLLERLRADDDALTQYFGQLRVGLLQMIAWLIGERRGAVPQGAPSAMAVYREFYASERCVSPPESCEHGSPWQRVGRVLTALWSGDERIGVHAWGCDLFDPKDVSVLRELNLSARDTGNLIGSIGRNLIEPCVSDVGIDTQLLGYVHEWLLERRLVVSATGTSLTLEGCRGHERRTTGSYFTPNSLVDHLLDVCVEPALDERIDPNDAESSVRRLLALRLVDPACGTGVFLIAGARRIAGRIDSLGRSSPAIAETMGEPVLRRVIRQCIYGVDIGRTTVSLCRLVLWFECGAPFEPSELLRQHIRCGNSTFGAWPGFEQQGLLDTAFDPSPGDDAAYAKSLKRRNRLEHRQATAPEITSTDLTSGARVQQRARLLADLWCAVFVWPKKEGVSVPTQVDFERERQSIDIASSRWREPLRALSERYQFFHWHQEYPDVFGVAPAADSERVFAGFDFVIGNPPWVAHAGRSTQQLATGLKRFLSATYRSFAGFPTTHGVFVELATRLLAARGRIGLILPASVADLTGYRPTREVHDQCCVVLGPLPDYGEGRFTGVTQPCIALISARRDERKAVAATPDLGRPWAIERSDLDECGIALLARIIRDPPFPDELFGERGFQSTPALRQFVRQQAMPEGNYCVPLREGTDVREYQLGAARHFADACLVNRAIRPLEEFRKVALVVRQTARYPIAARSDGLAFRNSLLAVLAHPQWPWSAMLCLLNSGLIRWLHYYRFRDGRQPILPQLKVGHLRSLPAPARCHSTEFSCLQNMGAELAARNQGVLDSERAQIDDWVCSLYDLSPAEQRMVCDWHSKPPR